jgi:hypothetical protein
MSASETSFTSLAGVPVRYDRLNDAPYGSEGKVRTFECREKLKKALETCMADLFSVWGRDQPSVILSAGTLGDGKNAHGQGYAFDLDGFRWEGKRFMMNEYSQDRRYISASMLIYFSISHRSLAITILNIRIISMSISTLATGSGLSPMLRPSSSSRRFITCLILNSAKVEQRRTV